jgi:hypothetical protein
MTDYSINAITRKVSYSGSAGVGPYAFTFEILDQNDVAVYKNTTSLTLTTDYTVTINANGTGSVTLLTAATVNDTIVILGARDIERTTDFVTAGDLRAESLNEQLDSLVIFDQQIDERVDRAIRAPAYDPTGIDMTLPSKADRANKVLQFDTEGNVDAVGADDLFTGTLIGANYTSNTFTGNGSQLIYTLTAAPGSKNNIQIYIDGVYQNKATFSISSTTLTFSEAPPLNASIECIIGEAIADTATTATAVDYTYPATGAVERTLQTKLQEFVSVKDFGAVGDGVTDDTAAIQATHDAAVNAGFSSVYFPSGNYRQTSQINWSPYIQARSLGYVTFSVEMATGFAWNISTQWGPNSSISGYVDNAWTILFLGGFEFNATNATNTLTCFLLGSSDTATWSQATRMFSIEGIGTTNFEGAVELGDHCYMVRFRNCHFAGSYDPARRPNTNGLFSRSRVLTDAGTNCVFHQCTFDQLGNAVNTKYTTGRLYLYFNVCEFGACEKILALMPTSTTSGNVHTMSDCYFESTWNFGTAACLVSDCELHIKGGNLYGGPYTYNSPLLASVTNNGQMTVTDLQISLDNPVAVLISGDATSNIYATGFIVRTGTTAPTQYISTSGSQTYGVDADLSINGNASINSTPSSEWGIDFAKSSSVDNLITIADTTTYDLASGSGLVILHSNTSGAAAAFLTYGGSVTKLGGDSSLTNSSGTPASINFYFNGTDYRIQNLTGGSIDLFVTSIRTRTAS